MRQIIDLLKRFRSDERGAFLVLFGILAVVLIATAGAVVDYTSIEQARTRAQNALDSAALGLQPQIYDSPQPTVAVFKTKASAVLSERINDTKIASTVDTATINTVDGTLHLEGTITVPTAFVQLIGISSVKARIVSEATRKRLNIEVAMVLDNSGSMQQSSRMTNLKAAAKCAENILFNGDCDSTASTAGTTSVAIGVVPFTSFVNVGTGYKTATWMDQTGASDYSNDNFDTDDNDSNAYPVGNVNRWTLYSKLTNVSWQGCVESRKYPYDVQDLPAPTTATPDSLFIPEFAPDNPDSGSYSNDYLNDRPAACTNQDQGSWISTQTKTVCTVSATDSSTFGSGSCSTNNTVVTQKSQTGAAVTPAAATEPASINGQPKNCSDTYTTTKTSKKNDPNRYTNVYTRTCSYTFSDRELQERVCKYSGAIDSAFATAANGPNEDCPTNALLPLTNTKSSVTTALNAMSPQGFTNIHQGAIWGFHMLSPTEPLTQAKAYDTATYKVMIVMTDGENTYGGWNTSNINGGTVYWAYGYPWNNPNPASPLTACSTSASYKRVQSSTYKCPSTEAQMISAENNRFAETCTNAKAAGITIYTIGLATSATSDPSGNKTLLTNCASGSDHAYFPAASSELKTVFQDIATQLSNLRLAK